MEEKIDKQLEECNEKFILKLEYYRMLFKMFLLSLGTVTLIVLTVVGWSYTPIQDIAVLKREVKIMSEDIKDIKKELTIAGKSGHDLTEDQIIALKVPAVNAVCGETDDRSEDRQ